MSKLHAAIMAAYEDASAASLNNGCAACGQDANLFFEAADRIEALEQENKRLRKALEVIKGAAAGERLNCPASHLYRELKILRASAAAALEEGKQ